MAEREKDRLRRQAKQEFEKGVATITVGVVETVRSEARSALTLGLIGAAWGLGVAVVRKKQGEAWEYMKKYGGKAARWGVIWGWQAAAAEYNTYAKEAGLSKTNWFDNLAGAVLAYRAYDQAKPFDSMTRGQSILATQILTPMTMSGVRTVGRSVGLALNAI